MWLDIRIRLCGWTKSLVVSHVGVCIVSSIRSRGHLLVVGLPVLKGRDLGRGDPKLSLLRLWGQSSCFFQNSWTTRSLDDKELWSSTLFYATKSLPKDAQSLVSLAGDKLFAIMLLFCDSAKSEQLWAEFQKDICNNLARQLTRLGVEQPFANEVYDYELYLINTILKQSRYSLSENFPSMPTP